MELRPLLGLIVAACNRQPSAPTMQPSLAPPEVVPAPTARPTTPTPVAGNPRCPKTPRAIATGQDGPGLVVVDAANAYWTNQNGGHYTNPYRGAVMAMPLDGGPVQELVIDEHYPIELAVDETSLYWIDHDRPSHDKAPPKRIRKAPLTGGDAVTLASSSDALGIAVDAHCVYWTEARGTTGAVMAVAK